MELFSVFGWRNGDSLKRHRSLFNIVECDADRFGLPLIQQGPAMSTRKHFASQAFAIFASVVAFSTIGVSPVACVSFGQPPATLEAVASEAASAPASIPATTTLVLIAPLESEFVYLVDSNGTILHHWKMNVTGSNAYLFPDGTLMRSAQEPEIKLWDGRGTAGRIQKVDWHGNMLWDYKFASETALQHHDYELLPNGNVLFIAWERLTKEQAAAAGRRPSYVEQDELYSEMIVEVKPRGLTDADVVWRWRLWDHLVQDVSPELPNFGVPRENPRRVNVNYFKSGRADWIHMNAVDYNAALDQIILSPRYMDELWIIDHSTTLSEAASSTGGRYGHGGDLLYRMGNPATYGAGTDADKLLFGQHNCTWIQDDYPGAGDVTVFNNGTSEPRVGYSSVDQFRLPQHSPGVYQTDSTGLFIPPEVVWSYSRGKELFSNRIGGAERLRNGNTLICSGDQPWILEVSPDKKVVWETQKQFGGADGNTPNWEKGDMFRAPGYTLDYFESEVQESLTSGN